VCAFFFLPVVFTFREARRKIEDMQVHAFYIGRSSDSNLAKIAMKRLPILIHAEAHMVPRFILIILPHDSKTYVET